jgi:hypothetical protein
LPLFILGSVKSPATPRFPRKTPYNTTLSPQGTTL